jgi:hypothetical protein
MGTMQGTNVDRRIQKRQDDAEKEACSWANCKENQNVQMFRQDTKYRLRKNPRNELEYIL